MVLLSRCIVMMTNGPAATIGSILDIKLQRPILGEWLQGAAGTHQGQHDS